MAGIVRCAACGRESPDDFRFCPACGGGLEPVAAGGVSEERKVVTALFCDIVGFTAMSEAADPEDIDGLLGEYSARARHVIEHHGGVVEKFIGDAVVGVFGVPAAHDDDSERAVRAALRLLEALEGLRRPDGEPLQVRCGVNTGEAVVRLDVDPASGRGFLAGDAVNTAARLQSAAPAGSAVAGALTHALTERTILYEELTPVVAKGKARPLAVWRAVSPRSRTGLRTAGTSAAALVGRGDELRALLGAYDEAREQGQGRAVLLVGEPGMGKSRLVLELAHELEARTDFVLWRLGRCLPYGEAVALSAVTDLVTEQAGIKDSDDDAAVGDKLDALELDVSDPAWVRRHLRPLVGLPAPETSTEEAFAAWTAFVESLAARGGAVIVLEDLHWADDVTLAFLDHLAARQLVGPLLVLATTRPELLQRRPDAPAAAYAARVVLEPLGLDDSERLVAALLGGAGPAQATRAIAERTGGNPLFAEEYVRLLGERGDGGDGGQQEPASVQAVIAARLDTLPPGQKAVLLDAAVFGETFWAGGVAAAGVRPAAEVAAELDGLVERQLVRPATSSSLEGEREFLFWHALTRDVAYGLLTRAARAARHSAVGSWLEARTAGRPEDLAGVVAHHYVTALELAQVAGADEFAESLVAPAMRNLELAGDRALRFDARAAERHLAKAVALAGEDTPERGRLLKVWAHALGVTGHNQDSVAVGRRAIDALLAAGDLRQAAQAMCWQSSKLENVGEAGGDLVLAAWELLKDDGPSPERAEALVFLAYRHYTAPRPDLQEALRCADAAVELCEQLRLPDRMVDALGVRAMVRMDLGDLGAFTDLECALATGRELGLGVEVATIAFNSCGPRFQIKGTQAVLEARRDALAFAESRGLDWFVAANQAALVGDCLFAGLWDEALDAAAQVAPLLEEHRDLGALTLARAQQAVVLISRGDVATTVPWAAQLQEWGGSSGPLWVSVYALVGAGLISTAAGDRARASDSLSRLAALENGAFSNWCPEYLPLAVRAALELRDLELAERLGVMLGAPVPVNLAAGETARALLLEARGDHPVAAWTFSAVAERWRELGVPYEEGHALFGQGRCLLTLGRAPEAAAPLTAARGLFARLGARPALAETEVWLARAGTDGDVRPSCSADRESGGAT